MQSRSKVHFSLKNPFRARKELRIQGFTLFIIFLFLSFLLFRKMAVFILITGICAAFTYINYYIKFPFDVSPVLLLSLIIAREYNFIAAIVFILLSGILPMILAGGNFDHTTLFYLSLIILVSYLSFLARDKSFLLVTAGLIVMHHFIGMLGAIAMGANPHKEYANLTLKVIVDGVYLLMFSGFVLRIMG